MFTLMYGDEEKEAIIEGKSHNDLHIIKIHITENVPGKHFYLWCLQPYHNEILHEGGPLDPNYRKTTLVRLP